MTPRPRIDYCLVGDQPAPNLLPYLDARFRPSSVVLVATPEMDVRVVPPLERVLSEVLRVETLRIADAYDFGAIVERIRDHAQEARARGFDTWLNVTGGTKPMAIAAYTAFEEGRLGRVYYLNPKTNLLTWYGEARADPPVDLDTRIDLRLFLAANGYQIAPESAGEPDSKHVEFAERVGRRCIDLIGEMRLANAVFDAEAKRRAGQKVNSEVPTDYRSALGKFLEPAVELRLGTWRRERFDPSGHGETVKETWQLLRGKWLELYVFAVLKRIPGLDVQDLATGVKIVDQAGTENEFDVAALVDDRLVLIECKTGAMVKKKQPPRMTGDAARLSSEVADRITYKMAALKPVIGGLRAKSIVVSLDEATDAQVARARDNGIDIISGAQAVANLTLHLRTALKGQPR